MLFRSGPINTRDIVLISLLFLVSGLFSLSFFGEKALRFTPTVLQPTYYLPTKAFIRADSVSQVEQFLFNLQVNVPISSLVQDMALLGARVLPIPVSSITAFTSNVHLGKFSNVYPEYSEKILSQYAMLEQTLANNFKGIPLPLATATSANLLREYIEQYNPRLSTKLASRIAQAVMDASKRFSIPFPLLLAVLAEESNLRPYLQAKSGYFGLAQLSHKRFYRFLRSRSVLASEKDLLTIETNVAALGYLFKFYYTTAEKYDHKAPVRYVLHKFLGARNNNYVERIYQKTLEVMQFVHVL